MSVPQRIVNLLWYPPMCKCHRFNSYIIPHSILENVRFTWGSYSTTELFKRSSAMNSSAQKVTRRHLRVQEVNVYYLSCQKLRYWLDHENCPFFLVAKLYSYFHLMSCYGNLIILCKTLFALVSFFYTAINWFINIPIWLPYSTGFSLVKSQHMYERKLALGLEL